MVGLMDLCSAPRSKGREGGAQSESRGESQAFHGLGLEVCFILEFVCYAQGHPVLRIIHALSRGSCAALAREGSRSEKRVVYDKEGPGVLIVERHIKVSRNIVGKLAPCCKATIIAKGIRLVPDVCGAPQTLRKRVCR